MIIPFTLSTATCTPVKQQQQNCAGYWKITKNDSNQIKIITEPDSLADAKVSAPQQCAYDDDDDERICFNVA